MEFKIKTPELRLIDEEVFKLNKRYAMAVSSLRGFPNIYAAKEIMEKIRDLKSKIEKVKTKDKFETLLIENILKNFESQQVDLEYFTTRKKENIDSVFEKILGERSLEIIKDNIKTFDYKVLWEFYISYEDYTYRQLPYDDESLREKFKEILANLKIDVLHYAEKYFNLPKDYEFDLILGQPYSERTYFNPTTKRMEISPVAFFAFKNENKIKINICAVIMELFHELLGHGRHEFNSRPLPLILQDNSISTALYPTHIHAEGIAQIAKNEAIDFMKKYKEKYQIEDDYIKQRELYIKTEKQNSFWAYYQYLQLKNLEDSSLNIEKEFFKLTNNYGLYLLYSNSPQSSLSCIRNATYPIGQYYLNLLLDNIKKEFGESYFQRNHALINQAISTGVWHFKVLPKFVKLFLKNQ